jgi:hypothetical protein
MLTQFLSTGVAAKTLASAPMIGHNPAPMTAEQIETHRAEGSASQIVRIERGQQGRTVMPHSEVCMHMQVAGREMLFALLDDGSVQLLNEDGSHFSFPITNGEAGVYEDDEGYFYHPARDASNP